MRKKLLCLFIVVCSWANAFSAELAAKILDADNFTFGKNIQIAVTLPERFSRLPLDAGDCKVYLQSRSGKPDAARPAAGVFFWRIGKNVFLDVRELPALCAQAGEYSARMEMTIGGEKHNVPVSGILRSRPYKTDVVLLVDTSFSMARNDPGKKRLDAARAFWQLAGRDNGIGNAAIVCFNELPRTVLPLTPVRSGIDAIEPALRQINAAGQTNIGKALLQAERLLANSPGAAVVLLTDGRNESVVYQNEHLLLARRKIPIYAVGLSAQADQNLLQTLAQATGGKSYWTADSRELTTLYLNIAAEIGNFATILKTPAVPGADLRIPVDSSVRELCLLVDNPDARWQLLPPPGGEGLSAVREYSSREFSERRVPHPTPGMWTARFTADSPTARLQAKARTGFFLDTFPPIDTPQGTVIGAVLANSGKAVNAQQITFEAGERNFTLYDDGKHLDGAANDGIFAALLPRPIAAKEAKIFATGQTPQPFRRETQVRNWKNTGGYVLAEQVRSNAPADCGTVIAGGLAHARLTVNYEGVQPLRNIVFHSGVLRNQAKNPLTVSEIKIPGTVTLQPGENVIPLEFPTAADQQPGAYSGTLTAKAGNLDWEIPLRVQVTAPSVTLLKTTIALGQITGGEQRRISLPLQYSGSVPLKISARLASTKNLDLLTPNLIAAVPSRTGETQEISMTFQAAAGNGCFSEPICLQTALGERLFTVTGTILPASSSRETSSYAHENRLPVPGEICHASLPVHEWQPRLPTSERVVMTGAHELRLAYTPAVTAPAANADVPADNSVWIFSALVAAIVLLLLLRRGIKSRIARFALLSTIIHLPILGVIAVYFWAPEPRPAPRAPLTARLVNIPETSPAELEAASAGRKLENQVLMTASENSAATPVPAARPALSAAPATPEISRPAAKTAIPEIPVSIAAPLPQTAALPKTSAPLSRAPLSRPLTPPAAVPLPPVVQAIPENPEKPNRRAPEASTATEDHLKISRSLSAVAPAETLQKPQIARPAVADSLTPPLPLPQPQLAAMPVDDYQRPRTAVPESLGKLPPVPAAADIEKNAPQPLVADKNSPSLRPAEKIPTPMRRQLAVPESAPYAHTPHSARHDETSPDLSARPAEAFTLNSSSAVVTRAPAAATVAGVLPRPPLPAPVKEKLTVSPAVTEKTDIHVSPTPRTLTPATARILTRLTPATTPRPATRAQETLTATVSAPLSMPEKLPLAAAALSRPAEKIPSGNRNLPEIPHAMAAPRLDDLPPMPAPAAPQRAAIPASVRLTLAPVTAPALHDFSLTARRENSPAPELTDPAAALPADTLVPAPISISRTAAKLPKTEISGWRVRMADVNFSIGLSGIASDQERVMSFLRAHGIEPASIALTAQELNGCGVVLIAEKIGFTAREGQELRRYVDNGGRLWLHRCHGFPPALSAGGKVVPFSGIPSDRPADNVALELNGKIVAIADENPERSALPAVINFLSGREIFVPLPNRPAGNNSELWQNFSGLSAASLPWQCEKWGNPVTISLAPDGDGGEALHLELAGGKSSRAAVSFVVPDSAGRRLNLQGAQAHYADIFSAGREPVRISLSLTNQTEAGWDEFETAPVTINPGWNRNVRFALKNLRSRRAESAADSRVRRGYIYAPHGAQACAKITYYFHSVNRGAFLLDNLRWEKP